MVIFKEIKKCMELSQFVEMKTESGPNIFGDIWTIFMRYVEFPEHLFSYFCPNAFIQTHIIKKNTPFYRHRIIYAHSRSRTTRTIVTH